LVNVVSTWLWPKQTCPDGWPAGSLATTRLQALTAGRSIVCQESVDQLKQAVEGQHGGKAVLSSVAHVKEVFEGKTVWEGKVYAFDLDGHPKATRAYAWSSPIEGSDKRRFFAVLHLGGIRSPLDAVRAAIVAEHRHGKG
jgi:hypothetical protein